MTRIVHLAKGDFFLAEATQLPAEDPAPRKPSRMEQIAAAREERRAIEARHRLELLGAPAPARRTYGPVPLIRRRDDQCSYIGAREGICCGKKVVAGRSWCEEHKARVFA